MRSLAIPLIALLLVTSGCRFGEREFSFPERQIGPHESLATQIEYPDVESTINPDVAASGRPRAAMDPGELPAWDMSLADAVRMCLAQSEVLRNLGGTVVRSPGGSQTMFEPALTESDPRASVEAALSEFDAQLTSSLFWTKIDRGINQTFSGQFLPVLLQRCQSNFVIELAKTAATGTRFSLRHHMNYDRNEVPNPSLQFPSIYQIDYEMEFRQPLLQGAGVEFNRIAGPNAVAGGANGVLLARINTDISLADFEAGVTDLVRDVEQAYWDLYFAYRDLDAKVKGRDSALVTWRNVAYRLEIGLEGGSPGNEAQLRSQYFDFAAAVDTATANLYAAEESLRYILGLAPNGPELIRPATEPSTAQVIFDWHEVLNESYIRRVELRKQKWLIQRRELELVAARNFLKPRLDAVALYRWRGFGDTLAAPRGPTGFESAYQNLTTGRFQEWQIGLQLNVPIGFRREFTALRNAELRLARERAILREQEFQISHDLSSALRELERAFILMKSNLNRYVATDKEVRVIEAGVGVGFRQLDVLLQAERRRADAESSYYRAMIDYATALRDVHLSKGSLLEYNGITLSEGPWANDAYRDALRRSRHFVAPSIDYGLSHPLPLSRGRFLQNSDGMLNLPEAEELPPEAQQPPVVDELPALPAPPG
jgi:outer membrane protein TolC